MNSGQRYLGMTLAQIGILTALALVGCVVIGILGTLILNIFPGTQQAEPTYTLQPSPTAIVIPTAWPTVTPIPNWQEYSFTDGRAKIWLPASYIGGEPATSSVMLKESLRTIYNDEVFLRDMDGLLAIPEIDFIAFDTEFVDSARFMYVGTEALNPDLDLSMDYYLNRMMDNFTGASDRVIERQIAQLEHYQAGKLVIVSKVPAENAESFITMVIYLVRVDDTMWSITFRTGREEFKTHQQTIETSANSFWVKP